MKRLILNADDLGLTSGINRAVVELHQAGHLTSTTLMASSEQYEEAVACAIANPKLGVGCHVVLVDGRSVAGAEKVPSLIDPATGELRITLGAFVMELLRGHLHASEIEAETIAQIRRLQKSGIHPTHIDTHKHTHLFPAVLDAVLRGAHRCGVRAVRNPFEPAWSVKATHGAPWKRMVQVMALRLMHHAFRRLVKKYKFVTTDGSIGILATGTLNAATIESLIKAMPDGTWELCCHPGYNDEALAKVRTRLHESREIERDALLRTSFEGVEMISFKALHPVSNKQKEAR